MRAACLIISVAEREEVGTGVDKHHGHKGTLDGFALGRSEEEVIQSVLAAGGQDEQVVLEIALTLARLARDAETVLLRLLHLIGDSDARSLGYAADMRQDLVHVLLRFGAVVVGFEKDDVRTRLAREVCANLCLIDLFLQH